MLKDIEVWDGSRYRKVIGKVMTANGLKDFYRPIDFQDDTATQAGLSRFGTSAFFKKNVGFVDNFDTMRYGTYGTVVNSVADGVINLKSTNGDPMLYMEDIGRFDPNIYRFIEYRYRILNGVSTGWEVFFTNDLYPFAHGEHHIGGSTLIADGQWHTAYIDGWSHPTWKSNGNIRGFRFDWATAPGVNIEIDHIKFTNYSDTVLPVSNSTGFHVGQEVTIADGINSENVRITGVSASDITITPLSVEYQLNAIIARSTSVITSGKIGYLTRTTYTITAN